MVRERSQITAKIFIMTMSHADSHKLEYVFGLKFGVYYQIFTPSLWDDSRRIWRSFALCTIESLLYPSCFLWMAIISPFQICIRKVRYCVHRQVNFQTINNRKSSFLPSLSYLRDCIKAPSCVESPQVDIVSARCLQSD